VSENHENLPLNRAFLRSVDLRKFLIRAIKETFHVVHEKALRFWIDKVQPIVIDDASLGLRPFSPAWLANFSADFLSEFSRQWCITKRRSLLPTTGTFDFV